MAVPPVSTIAQQQQRSCPSSDAKIHNMSIPRHKPVHEPPTLACFLADGGLKAAARPAPSAERGRLSDMPRSSCSMKEREGDGGPPSSAGTGDPSPFVSRCRGSTLANLAGGRRLSSSPSSSAWRGLAGSRRVGPPDSPPPSSWLSSVRRNFRGGGLWGACGSWEPFASGGGRLSGRKSSLSSTCDPSCREEQNMIQRVGTIDFEARPNVHAQWSPQNNHLRTELLTLGPLPLVEAGCPAAGTAMQGISAFGAAMLRPQLTPHSA